MSGSNSQDSRNQYQQFPPNPPNFRPPPVPGHHVPGQVPPFIDPRFPNAGQNNFPVPPGRHPIPPVRFPGHHPMNNQFPGLNNNRQNIGAPAPVHQPNQFINMHQQQHQPLPTGPAFHAMVHAQNMYPIRTTSGGSTNSSEISSPVTSPTQAPTRKLPPIPSSEKDNQSIRSGFQDIKKTLSELQDSDDDDVYKKAIKKGVDTVIAASATATAGTALVKQGATAVGKMVDGKVNDVVSHIEKNPVLGHLIQVADKLVDVGKVVPFIAPAFIILKFIIDIEQKARESDAKCNDLLERITFMVSNLTVLEKVKVIDPLKAVIEKTNDVLKHAASLIQAYRKQGAIAKRLNMSNNQNFVSMADKIVSCSQDLMLSLQIQQTGDISILTRSVPSDPQDEEARAFVASHGGQSVVNNNPALVEEFAKKMHLAMSDQVMDQMQSNMEDILEENQSRIETLLKENSSAVVAETIKALANDVREREAEQRLTCLQCDKEYRESSNGPEACSFHKSRELNGGYSCCGKNSPCTFSNHRSVHHCEYPYTNFFEYAANILGYTDTTRNWAEIQETDLENGHVQKASVSKLIRWKSYHGEITQPMMVIHAGYISYENPYYFQAYDANDLKAANSRVQSTGDTLIFKSTDNEDEYSKLEWTKNTLGDINGVKLSCKTSTCDIATVKFVPLDLTTVSLSGEIQVLSQSKFKIYKPSEKYELPEIRHVGHILRSTPLRETREFKAKTKLPLVIVPQGKMKANEEGRFVRPNADKFQGSLRIFNKSSPGSQTYVTLASCKAEYRLVGEQEYKEVESLTLGDVKFPISVAPTQSLDVPFEAIVRRPGAMGELHVNCWYWAMIALHHPIRVRFTFKDIEGEECVLVQEYIHKPSNRMATKDEEKDILFLHIDDSMEANRHTIRVTKGDGKDEVINVNGTRYSVEQLNKIVFKAEKSGVSEYELRLGRDSGYYNWKCWALVDLSCRRVYAFKLLLTETDTKAKKTTAALGYALCPEYGQSEGEELEERPIQYANEVAKFPELEPEDPLNITVDDDIDDEKAVPVQSVEPAVAIATAAAASVSVTAAISEVSKATASLDTAVFSSSIASLEKRLESLDTNVARMATALEKLVEILSP